MVFTVLCTWLQLVATCCRDVVIRHLIIVQSLIWRKEEKALSQMYEKYFPYILWIL